jgi:hypothetical protein
MSFFSFLPNVQWTPSLLCFGKEHNRERLIPQQNSP